MFTDARTMPGCSFISFLCSARNGWKRKYFDTKKATSPLEESLKNVRQELETFYHKLLQQLQAREGRNKHKRLGKASNIKVSGSMNIQ